MRIHVYIFVFIGLLLLIGLFFFGLWLCIKLGILDPWLDRTSGDVSAFLRSVRDGQSNAHAVDDFEHIPIKHPGLDRIREEFVQLGNEFPNWNGEGPFPLEGRAAGSFDRAVGVCRKRGKVNPGQEPHLRSHPYRLPVHAAPRGSARATRPASSGPS